MKLRIPTRLDEITLGQLMEISKLEMSEIPIVEVQKRTIEILTGCDSDTINLFRLEDLDSIYVSLANVLSEGFVKLHKLVTIEGVKYGFHPDLSSISSGEFIDIDTFQKEQQDNLHLILAVLYRPVTLEKRGKYQIEPYGEGVQERAEIFKRAMPANVVNGSIAFFLTIGSDYLSDLLTSSQEVA